ncbi:MAG TPA: diguanylate cyclase [Candidatus Acidoferrum sp.]|nr:diguanylate cyclase [Candidatus Acidoferrum sp.]
MWAFFNIKKTHRIWHLSPVLTVGIVGVVASVGVWYLTIASENRAFEQEFSARANNQAFILQSAINDYWEKLYAVRAFFNSSNQAVTREEFENFSNSLMDAAILNISWIPRVKREERVAHELEAARDGLPDYHIRKIAPDGGLSVSPEQDEYFPKFYSTEAKTSSAYGLDHKDGGTRERTLTHIRDGNVLSISPPLILKLTLGPGDPHGFWAGVPVYARGLPHETVEDRRRNLLGFVQAVFQIAIMIDTKFADVRAPVRVYLFAPDAAIDAPPIYFQSRLGTGSIEAKSQAKLATGLQRSFPVNFGDVPWKLVVTPESASFMHVGHERSSIVLICGLLLSGVLTLFIRAMRRDARKLEIAHDRFEKQSLRFDAALNNMVQGLLMYDSAGRLIVSNRRFAELFGVPWEKWQIPALGTSVRQAMQLVHDLTSVTEKNQAQFLAELRRIVDRRTMGTIVFERTDGRMFSAACAPMTDGGLVLTFEDITENRRAADKISHMAHHDALTDLPNRSLFYEKMEELIRAPQGGNFAVFSLDLDHFKSVNDTLGHPIGDKLLQAVAGRMRGCIRETDIVARLGGDEFAIVQVTFEQPADAALLATRLIDAVGAPYQLDGHQVIVGTSIGIAIAPSDGREPDQLMKNADLALYRCKADGGSTYRFFKEQMDARMQERHTLDLRRALVNGESTLDDPPIISLKTAKSLQ